MITRRHTRAALLLALVVLPTAARAAGSGRLALWLDGRAAVALHSTIAGAAAERLVPAPLVAREQRHAHGATTKERVAALATRLHAAVLYARVDGEAVTLLLTARGEAPAERTVARRDVAAAVRDLLRPAPRAVASPAPAPASSSPRAVASPASSSSSPRAVASPASSSPRAVASPAPTSSSPSAAPPARASSSRPVTSPPAVTSTPSPSPPAPAADEPTGAVVRALPPSASEPLFSVALDGGIGARRLQYNQPITSNLPSYSVAAVPWMGFRADLHPFARTQLPFVRGLGAFGDFGHSLYQQSVVAGGGPRVSASWMSYDVGVHERLRTGASRFAPVVGVALAYGRVAYDFEDAGQLISETPSVDYRYVRPALDAHLLFGRVRVFVDAGYRAVLSAGYVGSRFPHAQVGGVDVGAGVAVRLPRDLELRLAGQYLRFFYDFRPQPGDPYVAGGAVDEFAVGELALAYGF